MLPPERGGGFQARFQERWKHLADPDVRALAWLLDAPGLLDPQADAWRGRIAELPPHAADDAADWLAGLERDPAPLRAHLAVQAFTRLGRYAENLMSFYLRHLGVLADSGVQVRERGGATVGEFDFLVRTPRGLVHWEFATKLYLLEASGSGCEADYFVGPNLADTLGRKMRKIFDRQLSLADHPAAAGVLPEPVVAAQALVKGWLFYHDCAGDAPATSLPDGVSAGHCIGFWRALADCGTLDAERFLVLPRLRWLEPARAPLSAALPRDALLAQLGARFAADSMPVLVALARVEGGEAFETARGFIVPDDWRERAGDRVRRMQVP